MTAAKSTAWTDEERASAVRQKAVDYETGADGKPLRVDGKNLRARPAICETRTGKPDDLAFVVDSWTKNDPELRKIKISDATRHVRRLLNVATASLHELPKRLERLLIAHVPGEPDSILGWAAIEQGAPGCVHYVYVRKDARRMGVARALVGNTDVALEYSHAAPRGIVVPVKWTLNEDRANTC